MTRRFGPAAERLAGMSGVTLGWSPDRFWQATPAELATVLAALAPPEAAGIEPAELRKLMERFPDG